MLFGNILGIKHTLNLLPFKDACVVLSFSRIDCTPEDVYEIENYLNLCDDTQAIFDLTDDEVVLTIYYGDNN